MYANYGRWNWLARRTINPLHERLSWFCTRQVNNEYFRGIKPHRLFKVASRLEFWLRYKTVMSIYRGNRDTRFVGESLNWLSKRGLYAAPKMSSNPYEQTTAGYGGVDHNGHFRFPCWSIAEEFDRNYSDSDYFFGEN